MGISPSIEIRRLCCAPPVVFYRRLEKTASQRKDLAESSSRYDVDPGGAK